MVAKPVTVAQIAELAGVSVPTVSKVLNRRKGVAEETRAAVERIITESGYERRGQSGFLSCGIIDVLVPAMDSQWAFTLVQGINEEAQRLGRNAIFTTNIQNAAVETGWIERMSRRGSDAVILADSNLSETAIEILRRRKTPVVVVGDLGASRDDVTSISVNNWAGGLTATEHLIGLGHTRIGIITGPERESFSLDRLDGYSAALRRAGIALDPDLIKHGNSMISGGKLYGEELLDLENPPTAIFSCSDEQAYGVYEVARDRGLKIPKDLSIIGFDDVALCQWISPQLTTIHQPLQEMGGAAVRRAIKLASDPEATVDCYELSASLVVRKSTAKPRSRRAGDSPLVL